MSTHLPPWAIRLPYLFWLFTKSDFNTFVIPNTSFGLLSALASVLSERQHPPIWNLIWHAPLIVMFNWFNVLNFNLANQRSPESQREDLLNKPWRPIVTKKVTADQARKAMFVTIPIALVFNYVLGVWKQGVFILLITWMYNDLRGGDEIIRDLLISIAYGMFNSASLGIALGIEKPHEISRKGISWIAMVSGVILTTMQVQDLKDQAGDKIRNRRTVPLVFGNRASRVSIAISVISWSVACPYFWGVGLLGYLLVGLFGFVVTFRVMRKQGLVEDCQTWKWWCLWTMALYLLPIMYVTEV